MGDPSQRSSHWVVADEQHDEVVAKRIGAEHLGGDEEIEDVSESSPPVMRPVGVKEDDVAMAAARARSTLTDDVDDVDQGDYDEVGDGTDDSMLGDDPPAVSDRIGDASPDATPRARKRRRISISPVATGNSESVVHGEEDDESDADLQQPSNSDDDENTDDDEQMADSSSSDDYHVLYAREGRQERDTRQAPFHRAPRFRVPANLNQVLADGSGHHYPQRLLLPQRDGALYPGHGNDDADEANDRAVAAAVPDIFSPQRRWHKKYVPGGLAATVRDWLVDVKSGSAAAAAAASSTTDGPSTHREALGGGRARFCLHVEDVREARGFMVLVRARATSGGREDEHVHLQGHGSDDDCDPRDDVNSAEVINVLLAGEGRIVGIQRPVPVRTGALLNIYEPIWDVDLQEQGTWVVAWDWEAVGP